MKYRKIILYAFIVLTFLKISFLNASAENSIYSGSDVYNGNNYTGNNGDNITKFPINYNANTTIPVLPEIESYILIDPNYASVYGEQNYVLNDVTYSAVFKYASDAKDYLKKRSGDALAFNFSTNKPISPDKVDANKIMTRIDFVQGEHYVGIGSAHFLGMSNVLYYGLGISPDEVVFKPAEGKVWSMQVGNSSPYTITNWGMENITIDGQVTSSSLLVINSSPARPSHIKTTKPLASNIVMKNIKFSNCNGRALAIYFAENILLKDIVMDDTCANPGKTLFYMAGFHNAVIENFDINGAGDFTVGGYEYDFTSDRFASSGLDLANGYVRVSGTNSSMFSNGTVYLYVPESESDELSFSDYPVSVVCQRTQYEFPDDNFQYPPDIYMFKTLEQARTFTNAPYMGGVVQAVIKRDSRGVYSYFVFDDAEWGNSLLERTIAFNFDNTRRWSPNFEKPNIYMVSALNAVSVDNVKQITGDYSISKPLSMVGYWNWEGGEEYKSSYVPYTGKISITQNDTDIAGMPDVTLQHFNFRPSTISQSLQTHYTASDYAAASERSDNLYNVSYVINYYRDNISNETFLGENPGKNRVPDTAIDQNSIIADLSGKTYWVNEYIPENYSKASIVDSTYKSLEFPYILKDTNNIVNVLYTNEIKKHTIEEPGIFYVPTTQYTTEYTTTHVIETTTQPGTGTITQPSATTAHTISMVTEQPVDTETGTSISVNPTGTSAAGIIIEPTGTSTENTSSPQITEQPISIITAGNPTTISPATEVIIPTTKVNHHPEMIIPDNIIPLGAIIVDTNNNVFQMTKEDGSKAFVQIIFDDELEEWIIEEVDVPLANFNLDLPSTEGSEGTVEETTQKEAFSPKENPKTEAAGIMIWVMLIILSIFTVYYINAKKT